MENPRVSVIMPMFNEEKFIESCIESILNQDFEYWELIIVDDFSQDNSYRKAEMIAANDSRISLFRNKKKGILNALRLALSKANGRFISRMDADDIMPKEKLEVLYEKLSKLGPGHVVSGKVKYFSDTFLASGFKRYEEWINQQKFYEHIYQECTLPSACWMMLASDLHKIGGFKQEVYPEDYDLVFRLYKHKYKIVGIDQVLHLWRDHPERASRKNANYKDQNFFDLKLKYFFEIDYRSEKSLFLWGAGKKGKEVARKLNVLEINFTWITDNENKIGKEIYGTILRSTEVLLEEEKIQLISAISSRNFQEKKEVYSSFLENNNCEYFHFY